MSAIAMGLLKKGYSVSGSDLVKNNETNKLEQLGAVIFYSQIRTGHRGISFKIFKLRTMCVNAEQGKAKWAKRYDKRITKIG